jgi:parallel beta-helix repeat protein
MWRKTKAVIISFFFFLSIFYALDISFDIIDNASGATIYVNTTGSGGSFTSIQDAIDASFDGDTVFVFNGTYYENVVINKMINLYGEDRFNTTIHGNFSGNTITVSSDWVNITGFTVTGSGGGLGDSGMKMNNAQNCQVFNNKISNNTIRGIIIISSDYNKIYDNNISHSLNGLTISSSDNNDVYNNYVSYCDYGLSLLSALKNNVTENTVTSNFVAGIVVSGPCDGNVVDNNWAFENSIGLQLTCYGPSNISNNSIQNNQLGIYLRASEVNISNNSMSGSGIFIDSEYLSHWNRNEIDASNTVNGLPVYYMKNQIGGSVPQGFGQIILANCSFMSIENISISNGSEGIQIGFSSNFTIANNNISSQNNHGIMLENCQDSTIFENDVHNNDMDGIHLRSSIRNAIYNNNVSGNSAGINLRESDENSVFENNVFSNEIGISLESSGFIDLRRNNASYNQIGLNLLGCFRSLVTKNDVFSNTEYGFYLMSSGVNGIYYNNFTNNKNHANEQIYQNNWDNGYPWGGNYWSDYVGSDSQQGPNQDQPGQDGIGDEPYRIRGSLRDSYDHYPLMEPFKNEVNATLVHNLDKDIYYRGIQEAIDDADPKDTILVGSARYHENIIINKSLNLVGEDRPNTIVDGLNQGKVMDIQADWVNITGFSIIRGSGSAGINLENVKNIRIQNNDVWDNDYRGIYLYNCSEIIISNNNVSDNSKGVYCDSSSKVSIFNNTFFYETMESIYVTDSDFVTIRNNQAITDFDIGIYVTYSGNIEITDNNVSYCRYGIQVSYSDSCIIANNTVFEGNTGIYIRDGGGGNMIKNNTLVGNYYGIVLQRADGNLVLDNIIKSGKMIGIDIDGTKSIILKNNSMTECGIFIEGTGLDYWNTHDIDTLNTVNGKPVYYWKNQTGGTIPSGAGQVILANSNNVLVENQNVSKGTVGILLGYSTDLIIVNTTSNENNDNGIFMIHCDNNHFINNTVYRSQNDGVYAYYSDLNIFDSNHIGYNGYDGIYLRSSGENTVINNNISGNEAAGIHIYSFHLAAPSDLNHIENNTFSKNLNGIYVLSRYNVIGANFFTDNIDHGINLWNSESNSLSGNIMNNNGIFIYGSELVNWNTHTIDSLNTVNNKPVYYYKDQDVGVVPQGAGQIILANSDSWTIDDQNCSFGSVGVLAGYSSSITISNSRFYGNIFGVYFRRGDNNVISNCTVSYSRNNGIYLYFSDGNIIDNSTFNSNDHGIYLLGSDNDIIENNSLNANVKAGIYLWASEDVVIHNNSMIKCGVFIESNWLQPFLTLSLDESNTVNGRPIIYWKNKVGGVVPPNAGQVILANSTDVVIENHKIENATCGIELAFVSNIKVSNNSLSENGLYGIYSYQAGDNIILNNSLIENHVGICLDDSFRNTLFNNSIVDNEYGIQIFEFVTSSENNLIYHNNFIENLNQHWDNTGGQNIWNASYPIGGNYWSDYEGVDNHSGARQDEPGSDGFGDWPYPQYLNYWIGLDYYPLMNPTRDVLPPRIQLLSPGNNSVIRPGVILDFDIYDESSFSVNYSIDNGAEITFESPYDISTIDWADGFHTILIMVRDTKGNIASSTFSITIDSIPPIILLNSPSNNSLILKDAIMDFSITDSNLKHVEYSVNGEPAMSLLDPYDITADGWSDGDHKVLINAEDSAGNSNSSWYIFSIDSYPPIISLISPLNNSIIIEGEVLDFTVLDMNPVQANYSINGGAGIPFSEPYDISTSGWVDGEYHVIIGARDPLGHENSRWYSFLIDSSPPSIMFTSPGNNSVVSQGTIMDFSVTDENLDRVNYSVNGGSQLPLAVPYNISTTGWTNGTYSILLNAIDLAGNSNSSFYFISIDSTSPTIRLDSPVNGSTVIGGTALDFEVFDDNPSQVLYSINEGPLLSFSEPFNISTTGWDDGGYTVKIIALDEAGNSESSWFFITIDSSPPSISMDTAINHSTIPLGKGIKLNISDLEGGEVSYSIDGQEYIDLPLPYIIETNDWPGGLHKITVKAIDKAGNEASIWFEIIVDAIPPYVVDTVPFNGSMIFDIDGTIIITFSETMSKTNIDNLLTLSPLISFTASWDQDGTVISITFSNNNLAYGRTYTLKIDSELSDVHGNPLGEDFIFVFTTVLMDTDNDGTPDISDDDDDNDGYSDGADAFPLNASEWLDTDDDGIGNNEDTDDDNDGHLDEDDAYPLDPNIWKETKKPSDVNWLLFTILVIIVIFIVIFFALLKKRGFKPEKSPDLKEEKVNFEVVGEVIPDPLKEKREFN